MLDRILSRSAPGLVFAMAQTSSAATLTCEHFYELA